MRIYIIIPPLRKFLYERHLRCTLSRFSRYLSQAPISAVTSHVSNFTLSNLPSTSWQLAKISLRSENNDSTVELSDNVRFPLQYRSFDGKCKFGSVRWPKTSHLLCDYSPCIWYWQWVIASGRSDNFGFVLIYFLLLLLTLTLISFI